MHERDRDRRRRDEPEEVRREPPRPQAGADAVLALQHAIGNQGTARILAREQEKNRPSFEHSVKLGKLGAIEMKGGNIADWVAKKDPDGLKVVSAAGPHSAELKRLFETKARIDTVETSSVVGENTQVTITFSDCRIKAYTSDDKTEEWTVVFQAAKRQSVSIGTPRR